MERRVALGEKAHKGWYDRGYLPHFDAPCLQFITLRLFESVPKLLIEEWRHEMRYLSDEDRRREEYRRFEQLSDKGIGSCYLRDKEVAQIVWDQLSFFDKERYDLRSWVIMPNHVHVLILLKEGFSLPKVIQSLKARSARRANQLLKRDEPFWYRDYYDRYIRDESHYLNTVHYIEMNPVKAGLCTEVADWPWSSASRRFGAECYSALQP